MKSSILLFLVSVLTLASACGPGSGPTPAAPSSTPTATTSTERDPEAILTRTIESMDALDSYRFSAQVSPGTQEGSEETKVTGAWSSPDRLRLKMEGSAAGQAARELVSVGSQAFVRTADGQWQEQPVPSQGGKAPHAGLENLDSSSFELLPDTTQEGEPVFHLAGGQGSRASLPTPSPDSPGQPQILTSYELYITKGDFHLVNLEITSEQVQPVSGEDGSTGWETVREQQTTQTFFEFNAPVSIELPDVAGDAAGTTPGDQPESGSP